MFEDLEELGQKLKSGDVNERQEACYLLGKLEQPEAAEILLGALADPDSTVVGLAHKSLTRLEQLGLIPPGSVPPLNQASPAAPGLFTKTISHTENRPPASLLPNLPDEPTPQPQPVPNVPVAPSIALPPLQAPGAEGPPGVQKSGPSPTPSVPPLQSAPPEKPVAPAVSRAAPVAEPPPAAEEEPAENYDRLLPPLKPGASPKGPSAFSLKAAKKPAGPASPPVQPEAAPEQDSSSAPSANIGEWKTIISEKGETFPTWIQGKSRKEKIDILAEMEKSKPNILWSKKLQNLLTTESDAFVIAKLLKVFGLHHGPRILKYVEPFLEHSDTRVISNCLEALSLAGDPEDLERITQFLDHSDSRIKSTAAKALWQSNPKKALEVVKRLAFSQRVWEKDAAKFALVSCPLEERKALLEALSKKSGKKEGGTPEANQGEGGHAGKGKGSSPSDPSQPEWVHDLGILGRFLIFPISFGLGDPIPLWVLLAAVSSAFVSYFLIFNPLLNLIFPSPKL